MTLGGGLDEGADGMSRARLLFDLSAIDLTSRKLGRAELERFNPHRGPMALLDWVVWESEDHSRVVGLKHVRADEFWVAGHFPGRPMLPGVLMVEAAAQLACYQYNVRMDTPRLCAFMRIENATFRSQVLPGDDLLLLCQDVKFSRRRFIADAQGLVQDRVAFDARITGMLLSG